MKLMQASSISKIDNYAEEQLKISKKDLVMKSGRAAFCAIADEVKQDSRVIIFAGKGNNGADGYALAKILHPLCRVKVIDVFGAGQRTEEGKYYLNLCISEGVEIKPFSEVQDEEILCADVLVDAILGTGVSGEFGSELKRAAVLIESSSAEVKLAIDVPLGANPDTGTVVNEAPHFDKTVALSFAKPGVLSYPAKEYSGEVLFFDLDLPGEEILSHFPTDFEYVDSDFAKKALPGRGKNTNKGSFGRLSLFAGSSAYPGAPRLALEAALRGGVGFVEFFGEESMNKEMLSLFPEAIYKVRSPFKKISEEEAKRIASSLSSSTAVIVGPGGGNSQGMACFVKALLTSEGCPVIFDADGINALAELMKDDKNLLASSSRKVILTPHPGEFSRLAGIPVSQIQANRLESAKTFAQREGVVLLLKGAGSITTDGKKVYINSTGSEALAKAGSGDALAGLVGAFVATGSFASLSEAAALAAYIHGAAGDSLGEEFSSYGVTPSDLPKEMARQIRLVEI